MNHCPFGTTLGCSGSPSYAGVMICIGDPAVKYPLETAKGILYPDGRQTQADGRAAAAALLSMAWRIAGVHTTIQ